MCSIKGAFVSKKKGILTFLIKWNCVYIALYMNYSL